MFNGSKLKYIRLVNGLSRKELALNLGVTEQTIGQYETGLIMPKFDMHVKLNDFFGVSMKYFNKEHYFEIFDISSNIAFRNSDREQRMKVEFEKYFLNDIHGHLKYFTSYIKVFLDDLSLLKESLVKDFSVLSCQEIKSIAEEARRRMNIRDNKTLITELEKFGIIILEKTFINQTDACSVWIEDVPYIVLGNQNKSFVRRNFDLAHELGHLILHANREINELDRKDFDELEKQANLFATHFLIPGADFRLEMEPILSNISNPDAYINLKKKWKVSIAALGYRAYQEGIMTYQQYRYFNILLNKKNYKLIEPLDEEFLIIRPLRLKKMFEFVFDKGIISLPEFLDSFDLRVKGVSKKFSIESELFSKYMTKPGNIIEFKF